MIRNIILAKFVCGVTVSESEQTAAPVYIQIEKDSFFAFCNFVATHPDMLFDCLSHVHMTDESAEKQFTSLHVRSLSTSREMEIKTDHRIDLYKLADTWDSAAHFALKIENRL
jgi:hypothetical protein